MAKKFNYQGAKDAGYTDEEIFSHLSESHPGFNYKAALESGYEPEEIVDFLSSKKRKRSNAEDIAKQTAVGAAKGIGTAPGNIRELLRINPQEELLPGQRARLEAEHAAPEHLLPWLQEDDIAPDIGTGRFPTSQDAEDFLNLLGIDTQAETPAGAVAGKGAEALTSAATLGVGGAVPLLLAAAGGAGAQTLRELGAPEWVATLADVGINLSQLAKNSLQLLERKAITKPSGLPQRGFEFLEKEKSVLPSTRQAAIKGITEDFTQAAEAIQESANRSVKYFRQDPLFQEKLSEGYNILKDKVKKIPETADGMIYKKNLIKQHSHKQYKGFERSESEKTLSSLMRKEASKPFYNGLSFEELVDQFQKNNKELSKYLPYGIDAAKNEAKRELLLMKNRAIKDTINSEFGHLPEASEFNFLNDRWRDVERIKTVDSFVDAVTDKGKINFRKAEKIFEPSKKVNKLKDALGKQHFEDMREVVKDVMDYEKGVALLKAKKVKTHTLSNSIISMLFPKVGTGTVAATIYKEFPKVFRRGLADPKFAKDWSKALKEFRKGNVEEAIKVARILSSNLLSQPEYESE